METVQYTSPFFRADHASHRVIHRAPDTTQTRTTGIYGTSAD